MNYYRRKLIESWTVILALLTIVWLFQDNAFIARGIFVPAAFYFFFNYRTFESFRKIAPPPNQVIKDSTVIKVWCVGGVGLQVIVAISFLLFERDLGNYVSGFGSLLGAIFFPFIPAIFLSQVELYRRLEQQA